MTNAFTRKLARFSKFTDEETGALERLSEHPESLPRGATLIRQGERPEVVQLLLQRLGLSLQSAARR